MKTLKKLCVWARKSSIELLFKSVHNYQYLSHLIAFVFKKRVTFEELLKLKGSKMNLRETKCSPRPPDKTL